jgi:hypothetical protein
MCRRMKNDPGLKYEVVPRGICVIPGVCTGFICEDLPNVPLRCYPLARGSRLPRVEALGNRSGKQH